MPTTTTYTLVANGSTSIYVAVGERLGIRVRGDIGGGLLQVETDLAGAGSLLIAIEIDAIGDFIADLQAGTQVRFTLIGALAPSLSISVIDNAIVYPANFSALGINVTGHISRVTLVDGIADGAITNAKIADNAITASKIAADAITSAKIADNAITAAKIASNAITDTKIAAGAFTAAKFASGAFDAVRTSIGLAAANLDARLDVQDDFDECDMFLVEVAGTYFIRTCRRGTSVQLMPDKYLVRPTGEAITNPSIQHYGGAKEVL